MKTSTTKQSITPLVALFFSALLFTSEATADHHEAPAVTPVELYTCNFLKGKDMDDLDKVTAKWNAWMDETGQTDYLAVTLTPQFNDPGLDFEVGWMGGWPSGKSMGEGMHLQANDGVDILAKFDKVVDCGLHAGFATQMIIEPTGSVPETGVLQFSDCSIAEGKSEEVDGALKAWGQYQVSEGIQGPAWAMYPVYGGGDANFDFKFVTAHKDYRALGASFDQIGSGGGYQKGQEIFSGLLTCDVSRIYETQLRRAPAK